MKILIDAMGGDLAPNAALRGAIEAARQYGVSVVLVGNEDAVRRAMAEENIAALPDGVQLHPADDVVDMHDDPARVIRQKPNSSMVVGLRMLAQGEGDAFISAGSTGALLSGATLIVKRVRGIRRAAMAPAMPNKAGGKTVIVDCGANAECTPEFLLQFGMVGAIYAKKVLGVAEPRVGLLNIGTEDTKGTDLQKQAYALLMQAHENGILNFIGNVEARDVPLGAVDVVVCDGFSGNVLLKSIEGTAMFMGSKLKHMFKKNLLTKLGYLCVSAGMKDLMKLLDYREIGGTQFLGIRKPVIKAHGSSDALAFRNAVRQAMQAVEGDITSDLERSLATMKAGETQA